jgi:hypothetical protein
VLALQTNGTTAISIDASQAVTFAGAVSLSGNQTTTGNLTVNGNTTLGDASTDTILMTGAPSIGGAGYGMGMGFRNRIINGAMVIDQRNAGASTTPTTNGTYTLDRWQAGLSNASKYSVQQSSTAPDAFRTSLLVTSLASTSVAADDYYSLLQPIEGFNTSDLMFGTATAKTITISFWVRSSLTGTFGGWIQNSNVDRSYPFSYTISAANTLEQKTVTIAGDTSGTWVGSTNGTGLYVGLSLGMGSNRRGTANSWQAGNYRSVTGETAVVGTNGATFYITGVQLEKGSTATAFDYRPYGTELALCQRYYYITPPLIMLYNGFSTAYMISQVFTPVQMRSSPSVGLTTTSPYVESQPWNAVGSFTSAVVSYNAGHSTASGGTIKFSGTFSPSPSSGQPWEIGANQTNPVYFSSEL